MHITECFYSYQLCHLIKHGGLSERMYARVPFVVHEDEWISYDNPSSVQEKVIFLKKSYYGCFIRGNRTKW